MCMYMYKYNDICAPLLHVPRSHEKEDEEFLQHGERKNYKLGIWGVLGFFDLGYGLKECSA